VDRLGTIYGGPLVRGFDASPEKALQRVKASVLRRIRDKLIQSTFSDRAKRALYRAISVEIKASSLTIYARHPAFIQLIRGQRKGQMKWLTKARAPIPIITEQGELIFRSATIRSMKDGKWIHPGRPPYDFVEKAKAEAKVQIKKSMVKEMRRVAEEAARAANRQRKRR
jgi:hypothetical protein